MATVFAKNLRVVTGVHVVIIAALFMSGWMSKLIKPRKDVVIPVEFLVAVPPSAPDKPVQNDFPAPVKKPADIPAKKPPQKQKPIKISNKVVTNPNLTKTPPVKTLTPEEIQKLIDMGAKPSDRTVIPEDDQIYKGMVKKAFTDVWTEPSRAEVGDAVAEVEIRLAGDGTVVSAKLVKGSGVAALDESVVKALKFVKRVNGLSADFVSRYETLTISFRVRE